MLGFLTKIIFLFVLTFTIFNMNGQDISAHIKENAIKINKLDSLNNSVYKLLSKYQLIMVGEMHGTNEPATFLVGLAQLFVNNGDSIQIGLELPTEEIENYIKYRNDSSIYNSVFFSKKPIDGRENYAWAEIIKTFNKIKNVRLFFFDTNKKDYEVSKNRDSLMYIKIKKQIQNNSGWKTITLSGNIHNMLLQYRNINPMAYYLKMDKDLNFSDKICSINHRYKSGTMYNNTGNGLELKKMGSPDSEYSTSVDYQSYFVFLPSSLMDKYNAVFFTKNVTAAEMIKTK